MTLRNVPGWQKLAWNSGDDWAIPLPVYTVDRVVVQSRWYVPDELPVIPKGWVYKLVGGEVISEYRLWCRLQLLTLIGSEVMVGLNWRL